jgi:hypothetical protein
LIGDARLGVTFAGCLLDKNLAKLNGRRKLETVLRSVRTRTRKLSRDIEVEGSIVIGLFNC